MNEWLPYAGLVLIGAILYAIGYEVTKAVIDYIRERSISIKKNRKNKSLGNMVCDLANDS